MSEKLTAKQVIALRALSKGPKTAYGVKGVGLKTLHALRAKGFVFLPARWHITAAGLAALASSGGGRKLTIRERERRGYVREAQGYTAWTEYQVVEGRKILSRHDTLDQAEREIAALKSDEPPHA